MSFSGEENLDITNKVKWRIHSTDTKQSWGESSEREANAIVKWKPLSDAIFSIGSSKMEDVNLSWLPDSQREKGSCSSKNYSCNKALSWVKQPIILLEIGL